ncbi:TetR/AcrR family transcriptional regulator [Pedococcus bigeumensis]|uniref:TetR/AcrR family transcriptional regulator n=1 Tax=Pedococcus bigeumensis TaxID=433644 RepID=A0A502CZE7_9MICO|nr:TetR/AcrR family transcriptional regulator [Pedococcus bigeumensis]TPG17131.1 TetR/AcrR family transcriptional regulator [Pedococcus bigeumensis]
MVDSAILLLARGGYQATSFSSVLEASQAPRGSIYHHFPDGKDQLIAAAVELAGARAVAVLDSLDGLPAPEVVDGFMLLWRTVLARSDFGAGCSVLAVTVSSGSEELLDAAAEVFRSWGARLAELLQRGGIRHEEATSFATMVMAASEGAVVLARARRDMEPFDLVATQLREDAKRRVG